MIVVDRYGCTVTLSRTREASGEIAFDDIGAIAKAMQDLATRVGRLVVDQHGPGHTVDTAARVTRLRLRAIRSGSTVLDLGYGEHDTLESTSTSVSRQRRPNDSGRSSTGSAAITGQTG